MKDSADLAKALQEKIDFKTKPLGALGAVEAVARQVGLLQGTLSPVMERACLTIFAGDHGIAASGVSAFPAEVTRQMVLNFARGGAAANVFCRANGIDLRVVNAGVMGGAFDTEGVIERALGEGTANALEGPAMTEAQLDKALTDGAELGAGGDWHAMAFGEMGIGNTSAASLIGHKLTGAPLAEMIGRGTGVDDAGLQRKTDVLTRAAARTGDLDARSALREYGGFEIAMMTGAMIGAARARRVVLVDGFIATSAALAAAQIAPETRDAMIFAHQSVEPGHAHMLAALNADPLLKLDLRLGEGTGAALAWPIVRASVAMLNEMASFAEAGVSEQG